MSEIKNALAIGKEVITHTDAIGVPGWSGAGYVIFDPNTGDGAWKIGGGDNGAFLLFLGALMMVFSLATFAAPIAALLFGFGIWFFLVGLIDLAFIEDVPISLDVLYWTTGAFLVLLAALEWAGIIALEKSAEGLAILLGALASLLSIPF